MRARILSGVVTIGAALCLLAGCGTPRGADTGLSKPVQSSLRDFESRLTAVRSDLTALIASAEFAANRMLDRPGTLLLTPYPEQKAISEELIARSGGLAHAGSVGYTNPCVVFLTVRSWEEDRERTMKTIEKNQKQGWPTILIASKSGAPADLAVEYLVDNGAPSGGKEYGNTNALINATLAWSWCCEYYSAMSRRGQSPGILKGSGLPGGREHNKPLQTREGRSLIFPCPTPVAAGALTELYLKRVDRLIRDLQSASFQSQLNHAADIVADRMAQGRTVGLAGYGHIIIFEPKFNTAAPWKQIDYFWPKHAKVLKDQLQPGDLLVWIGYTNMPTVYTDGIAEAKVDLVSSYVTVPDKDFVPPRMAVAHIEQPWEEVDASVPIPTPPGRMAPISGISTTLTMRMLDDEVARRLRRDQ